MYLIYIDVLPLFGNQKVFLKQKMLIILMEIKKIIKRLIWNGLLVQQIYEELIKSD